MRAARPQVVGPRAILRPQCRGTAFRSLPCHATSGYASSCKTNFSSNHNGNHAGQRSVHKPSKQPNMAPKKMKAAVAAISAASTKKSSTKKLKDKVAAARDEEEPPLPNPADTLTDDELAAKNKERSFFDLPPLVRSVPPPSASPAAPSAAPSAAAEAPSVAPPPAPESPVAAGSALNAKRALDAAPPAAPTAPAAAAPNPAPPAAPSPPSDADLLMALKTARKEVADAAKLMTNLIVPTEALEAMATLKPTTTAQLCDVPGFGPTRAERYGQRLLECVRRHTEAVVAAGGSIVPMFGNGLGADKEMSTAAGGHAGSASGSTSSAAAAPSTPAGGACATIKYSHYSQTFSISRIEIDGGCTSSSYSSYSLDFRLVDDAYCLSHVFGGDFTVRLRRGGGEGGGEIKPDGGRIRLVDAEGKRAACGTFSAVEAGAECACSRHDRSACRACACGGLWPSVEACGLWLSVEACG